MGSAPENELWILCPVCNKPNPAGRRFCQHCWGAILQADASLTADELELMTRRKRAYLRRRLITRVAAISLTTLLILTAIVYPTLYYLTDALFKPLQGVNSNSLPGEWAMFRHDLGHSGATGSTVSLPEGNVKWSFDAGSSIHSSPAVANDTIYFGCRDFKLYALDIATGTKRWEYRTEGWVDSSPTVADGIVYFGSNDGRLYALDADTGERLWDFKTRYPVASSPTVANGVVYFGSDDYYIYALDAKEGTKLWDFETNGIVVSSASVADGIVYVGSSDGFGYALNGRDGRFRLLYKTRHPIFSSPPVSNGVVYFITDNGELHAVDAYARTWPRENRLRPLWMQVYILGLPLIPPPPPPSGYLWGIRLGAASSSPAVSGDTFYVGSDNKLIAVDLKNRQKLWEFEIEATIRSSPAVAGNVVYFASEQGRIYAVNASGEKLWELPLDGRTTSSPAVADGTIYIGSHDGKLYAIE